MDTSSIAVKFCSKATSEDNSEDCQKLVLEMLGSSGDKLAEIVEKLSNLTGKSADEIADIMYRSCPLCPE